MLHSKRIQGGSQSSTGIVRALSENKKKIVHNRVYVNGYISRLSAIGEEIIFSNCPNRFVITFYKLTNVFSVQYL